jgi:hypothetical protein
VRADPSGYWGERLPPRRLRVPATKYERDLMESADPWRGEGPGAQVGHIVSAELPRPVLALTPEGKLRWKRGRAFRGRTLPVRALNLEVSYRLRTCVVLAPSWAFVANYPSVLPFGQTTLY